MNYHQVRFTYTCEICGTNNFNSVQEFATEKYYFPIKIGNDTHNHDRNKGFVKLTCCNGHQTTQDYIPACECGWNSLVKYDPSKLYQEFEEKKE
jgi:hypothetical protein